MGCIGLEKSKRKGGENVQKVKRCGAGTPYYSNDMFHLLGLCSLVCVGGDQMRLHGTKGAKRPLPAKGQGPDLEAMFHIQVRAVRLPAPQREYKFHEKRAWKIDFAWPAAKIAVEIEGGTYNQGRHVRPEGFERDCKKYNQLTAMGWTLFRFTGRMVKSGEAIQFIEGIFGRGENERETVG
jgi:very-short-patch-repair endonuclease